MRTYRISRGMLFCYHDAPYSMRSKHYKRIYPSWGYMGSYPLLVMMGVLWKYFGVSCYELDR